MADWITGNVETITHWHAGLFSLKLTAPIAPFKPGQFIKLALEINGERIQRAYSLVNAPHDNQLEFYLAQIADGKLTPHLQQLKPGQPVLLTQQASGFFILDEVPDYEILWMFATGTGLSPYLSMLQSGEQLERYPKIVLVHAVRYAQDLNYLPLMQQLQQRYSHKLHLVTITSREQVAGHLYGRIPNLINSGAIEAATGLALTAENSHIMLCGNPDMVKETTQVLQDNRGMRKHLRRKPGHITKEKYW